MEARGGEEGGGWEWESGRKKQAEEANKSTGSTLEQTKAHYSCRPACPRD